MVCVNDDICFVVHMNVYDIVTDKVDKEGIVQDEEGFFLEVINAWNEGVGELIGISIGKNYYQEKVECVEINE